MSEGSQGPRGYEYAEVRCWFGEEGLPGPRERLLVRRSLGQELELKYHRSNAPAEVPLLKLAQVRATRWMIEEGVNSGKGQCGLDGYETRGWPGWHHHTALSMLASAFLVLQRVRLGGKRAKMSVPEVRALLTHLLQVRAWDTAEILRRSGWRRGRNRRAAVATVSVAAASESDVSEVGPGHMRCNTWHERDQMERGWRRSTGLRGAVPRLTGSAPPAQAPGHRPGPPGTGRTTVTGRTIS